MNLRGITIHDDVQDSLTGDHPVCRIVDVPIRANHRNAKVAYSISVGYRARIGQNHKRYICARDQPGLSSKCDKEQGILGSQLLRTAIQLLDLLNE